MNAPKIPNHPFTDPRKTLSRFSKEIAEAAEKVDPDSLQAYIGRELSRDAITAQEGLSDGSMTAEEIVKDFFDYYFTNQGQISGTAIGHLACVVGHDFGIDAGLSPETLEQYWKESQSLALPRS